MFSKKAPLSIPADTRVVLIAGGSGAFGEAVLAEQPPNTLVVNVSRARTISGDGVINCRFDLSREPEQAFHHLAELLPRVDVFVYAAYSPTFAPFEKIERERFLREYELNVFTAMLCTRLCAEHFWQGSREENLQRARKAILISSAAAFGKTSRPELASYSATKAAVNALGPYAHDYLFSTYGTPVAVLAPGSLSDPSTREKLVARFWELEAAPLDHFIIEKIV